MKSKSGVTIYWNGPEQLKALNKAVFSEKTNVPHLPNQPMMAI